MKAEIIAIGNEILAGHTVDTNSSWISTALRRCGITVRKKQVISDKREEIQSALKQVRPDSDLIFISGGLGPTRDDITKQVISEFFQCELVFDAAIFEELRQRYRIRGQAFLEKNRGQAYFPFGAEKIVNHLGTATGMLFRRGEQRYFVMPGVPSEMKTMMDREILPQLCVTRELSLREGVLRTTGIPESELAALVEPMMKEFEDIELGYYPGYHGVDLRFSAEGSEEVLDGVLEAVKAALGDIVYSDDSRDLVTVLSDLLRERGQTLALAESCSGGLAAHKLTMVPGASQVLREGLVTYSNESKMKRLGLAAELLESFGAVSRETVAAMLQGLRDSSDADLFAAVSGIAGPDGGSEEKPVGTVWMGVADREKELIVLKHFSSDRTRNIQFSAQNLLNLIRLFILDSPQTAVLKEYWK